MVKRSMARAGARFHRNRGASRPSKGEHAAQRIYLHVLKPKPGEPIVFDARMSWTPFLFGKTGASQTDAETGRGRARPAPKRSRAVRHDRRSSSRLELERPVTRMSEAAEAPRRSVHRLDQRLDGNRDGRGAARGCLAPVGLVHEATVALRRRSCPALAARRPGFLRANSHRRPEGKGGLDRLLVGGGARLLRPAWPRSRGRRSRSGRTGDSVW